MKKNTLSYKGYIGSVETDLDSGVLYGKILFIRDLVHYEAPTIPALKQVFEEEVDDYLETCEQVGKDPDKTFSGTFNTRIGPKLHREVALFTHQTGQAINDFVKEAVREKLEVSNIHEVHHTHEHIVRVDQTYGEDTTPGGARWELEKPPLLKLVR